MATKTRTIIMTDSDRTKLERLIDSALIDGREHVTYLESLLGELQRAKSVKPQKVPPNVVTMNSTVHLRDLDTGEEETYTLVFPRDADADDGRISVLAPIGTAIIGNSVGDTIEWPVPSGLRRLKVEAVVYQPERAGDYHL